jgi:hypothetical protein
MLFASRLLFILALYTLSFGIVGCGDSAPKIKAPSADEKKANEEAMKASMKK